MYTKCKVPLENCLYLFNYANATAWILEWFRRYYCNITCYCVLPIQRDDRWLIHIVWGWFCAHSSQITLTWIQGLEDEKVSARDVATGQMHVDKLFPIKNCMESLHFNHFCSIFLFKIEYIFHLSSLFTVWRLAFG